MYRLVFVKFSNNSMCLDPINYKIDSLSIYLSISYFLTDKVQYQKNIFNENNER